MKKDPRRGPRSACSPDWTRTSNLPVNSRLLCQLSYGGPSSPDWTRTSNLPVNSRLLCQLSYGGMPRCIERAYLGIGQGALARCDTYISASRGVLRQSVPSGNDVEARKGGSHALPARVHRRTGCRLRTGHEGGT